VSPNSDERQAGGLDLFLVGLGHHPRVRDNCDVRELVGGHERLEHRQQRLGLRLVALKRGDHQREPGPVGQQPDGDLRVQPPFLGEPGLAESVPCVGLEVQRGQVLDRSYGRRGKLFRV
jgi:hypothetical protein